MKRGVIGFGLALLGAIGIAAVVVAWVTVGAYGTVSPLWAALLPGLLLAIGLALMRREASDETEKPPDLGPTLVEVEVVPKGPVSACLRCGSRAMQPAPLGADALFSQWRCARCGFRGQPLQFDTGEDWAAFVKGLAADRARGSDRP